MLSQNDFHYHDYGPLWRKRTELVREDLILVPNETWVEKTLIPWALPSSVWVRSCFIDLEAGVSHDPEITATPFLVNSFVLLPKPLPPLAPCPCFCLGSIFFEMTLTYHHSVITRQRIGLSCVCKTVLLHISTESVKRHLSPICWACSEISSAWMLALLISTDK